MWAQRVRDKHLRVDVTSVNIVLVYTMRFHLFFPPRVRTCSPSSAVAHRFRREKCQKKRRFLQRGCREKAFFLHCFIWNFTVCSRQIGDVSDGQKNQHSPSRLVVNINHTSTSMSSYKYNFVELYLLVSCTSAVHQLYRTVYVILENTARTRTRMFFFSFFWQWCIRGRALALSCCHRLAIFALVRSFDPHACACILFQSIKTYLLCCCLGQHAGSFKK